MYLLLGKIGKECGCIRDEGSEEEEEILTCVQDCPNPRATECYDYYLENGVWLEGCEEVMTDCGCYDFGTELDCYKQALNYIRKHLTFEPNNACAVLAYVQDNFKCYTPEIVRPETPYPSLIFIYQHRIREVTTIYRTETNHTMKTNANQSGEIEDSSKPI